MYSAKPYTNTERYRLLQAHVNSVKLNGVGSVALNQGASHFSPQVLGRLMPVFRSLNTADGISQIETVGLGQLFETVAGGGLEVGLAPFHVDGASSNLLDCWWNAITELGLNANTGIRARMSKGVLHLDALQAMQNAPAVASCRAIPLYDGTNDLWIFDDVADLATAVDGLATEQDCWTFAGAWIDNVKINLASGFAFQNLPFITLQTGGDAFPRYGHVGEGQPMFSIPLQTPTPVSNLGIANLLGFGTKTDPAVEATSLVVKCVRCDANGQRKALGDGDIVIVANHGAVMADPAPGAAAGRMVSALHFYVHDDDLDTAVTFTKNADA